MSRPGFGGGRRSDKAPRVSNSTPLCRCCNNYDSKTAITRIMQYRSQLRMHTLDTRMHGRLRTLEHGCLLCDGRPEHIVRHHSSPKPIAQHAQCPMRLPHIRWRSGLEHGYRARCRRLPRRVQYAHCREASTVTHGDAVRPALQPGIHFRITSHVRPPLSMAAPAPAHPSCRSAASPRRKRSPASRSRLACASPPRALHSAG